jgi:hypothetical protein
MASQGLPPHFPKDRGMTVYRRVGVLTDANGTYTIQVGLHRGPKVINARFTLDATRAHQAGLKNHTPGYIVFEIMHMEDPMKNL